MTVDRPAQPDRDRADQGQDAAATDLDRLPHTARPVPPPAEAEGLRLGWIDARGHVVAVVGPQNPDPADHRGDPLLPYARLAAVSDLIAILTAVVAGYILRWTLPFDVSLTDPAYLVFVPLVVLSWVGVLTARGAYDTRVVGVGSEEFKRVVSSTLMVFAVVVSIVYLTKMDLSRGFLLIAFTGGLLLLLLGRWLIRAWLRRQRRNGHYLHRTLVVGSGEARDELAGMLDIDPVAGFDVVAEVAEPTGGPADLEAWLDTVMAEIRSNRVDTVAVAGSPTLGPEVVRRLAWRLEGPRIDLLVAPVLGDVAGPRVTMRVAADLPLLHLDEPTLTGPKRLLKRTADVIGATLLLVLLAPFMLLAAVLIKLTGRGPVLYTQTRIGQGGRLITVRKFRTMVVGADRMRGNVIGSPDTGIIDRYKGDPRITAVGRLLRRWSIDETPQFFNVLAGTMSLVGPRPMLVDELPLLADADHRRHLTKPGLTGLWQVSGRKEVDWDERMRLDLDYVEHWSPALDLVIAVKTVKAILSGEGAY